MPQRILSLMATAAAPSPPFCFFLGSRNGKPTAKSQRQAKIATIGSRNRGYEFCISASVQDGAKPQRAPPGVDTRIHWENEDEGWIGGSSKQSTEGQLKGEEEEEQKNLLHEKFADLLNNSSDSHYQFLGISAEADLEEIRTAYRRLSKEYHPDTTSLPLKTASEKFMKLREIYDVLSNEESRRFYDWTLAQEAASHEAEKMRMKLEDPYIKDIQNYVSVPDMVDRLGGRNMELSDQATSALTLDVVIIVFSICSIIYVIFFKEPYY